MREKALLLIAVACSLAGIFTLFLVSRNIKLEQTKISEILPEDIGKNVKICGKIVSKFVSNSGHLFLTVKDETANIKVVAFNTTAQKLGIYELQKYEDVCLTGTVGEYQGDLEIIISTKSKIEVV